MNTPCTAPLIPSPTTSTRTQNPYKKLVTLLFDPGIPQLGARLPSRRQETGVPVLISSQENTTAQGYVS